MHCTGGLEQVDQTHLCAVMIGIIINTSRIRIRDHSNIVGLYPLLGEVKI